MKLRTLLVPFFALGVCLWVGAAAGQDLKDFRTVETAITAKIGKAAPERAVQPAFLGVILAEQKGKLTVVQVEPGSPAEKAGLKDGDQVNTVSGIALISPESLRELLASRTVTETLPIDIMRGKEPMKLLATLTAPSRLASP